MLHALPSVLVLCDIHANSAYDTLMHATDAHTVHLCPSSNIFNHRYTCCSSTPANGWGSLLAPAPLERLPEDAATVRALLSDTRHLRIPVTPTYLGSLRDDQHGLPHAPDEMFVGASERIPRLTALVAQQPLIPQNATEMHTTVMMAKFIDGVFGTLCSDSHLFLFIRHCIATPREAAA
jgi:hypothetical protein